jgi:hypothetical protein
MGLKLLVPAIGVLLALAAAFAAACFVRAFGATYLGRARTSAAARAVETDRWSLAALLICAGLCLLAGVFPGIIIDWLQPATAALVAGHMPPQASIPWLSIVPVSASRSSYNGLLLFGFVVAAASLAAIAVHRFASRAVRKAPFWDCGYPGLGVVAQYSATSLAQPIRRVFATVAFAAHEQVEMPLPGDKRPATLRRFLRDPVWDFIYAPVASVVGTSAALLNHVQFLTIRHYLSFVFVALVVLLVVLALWA